MLVSGTDQDFNDLITEDLNLSNGGIVTVPGTGVWTTVVGPSLFFYSANDWFFVNFVCQYQHGAVAGLSGFRLIDNGAGTAVGQGLMPLTQLIANGAFVIFNTDQPNDTNAIRTTSLFLFTTGGSRNWLLQGIATGAAVTIQNGDCKVKCYKLPA